MRIAIDLPDKNAGLTENETFYLGKTIEFLASEYSEDEWILLSQPETEGLVSLFPMGIKKTLALRKLKADALISAGPVKKISLAGKRFIYFCGQDNTSKSNGKQLKNANMVITSASFIKRKIMKEAIDENRIKVINAAPDEAIGMFDWQDKHVVKERYSNGKEFFLCIQSIGANTDWENIFKAFSIFKKWQQTEVHLLIAGKIEASYRDKFTQKLASYKYRNDVSFPELETWKMKEVLPAAYGLIVSDTDATGINILNAFKSGVPVITSPLNIIHEAFEGSVLPAVSTADELARQMINLYRDERLRDHLIEKGAESISAFSWKKVAASWYDSLREVTGYGSRP